MAGKSTAGIDWASKAHEVCVSEEGRVNERFSAAHDERGIAGLASRLVQLGVARVATERPAGILVERLFVAGLGVLAIHPNQLKAARSREDLVEARVELANQLRAQLGAFCPGALVFAEVDSPISLAFIARYPSPVDARGLGIKRMAGFLSRNGSSGRTDPAEPLERMSAAPQGTADRAECEARRAVVLGLVAALSPIVAEIAKLSAKIRSALAGHPDAAIFAPLFRDPKTVICPATLIAEIGDCRGRYPTEAALAADAGMSPVALESGKLRVATFRRACDKRLRVAVATLADSTRHWHPWAREVYRRARARGQDHPHAIRTLGRAWIRVLWRCWQERVPYDPTRHGNLRDLQTAGG
jgi:transposase